jgi:hypothetical protein
MAAGDEPSFGAHAMPQWQINLRELFRIVTAGAVLYSWTTYWSPSGRLLVGVLLSAAILFWPSRNETDWTAKVARSIASVVVAVCLVLWDANGLLVGAIFLAALLICPNYEDQHWTVRYVVSNALVAVAIMLGVIVSVLRICPGR